MKKVLLIRLDKIGDLVCTLPVDESAFLDNSARLWVLAKGMGFVAEHSVPPREYVELDKAKVKESIARLSQVLQTFRPDVAVSFQAPWWVSWTLWKEGVPLRVGVRSQWHSFLFLNRSLRQRRSRADRHEADFNFELMTFAAQAAPVPKTTVPADPPIKGSPVLKLIANDLLAQTLLNKFNLIRRQYIIIHPGMAGSARNWPLTHYRELINSLLQHPQFLNFKLVVTGTDADRAWTDPLLENIPPGERLLYLQSLLRPAELLSLLQNAWATVAPSTGVLHLAASLGTAVVGIYSPIQVQRPRRWGARGPRVTLLEPPVSCPESHRCRGANCPLFDCMEQITVEQVVNQLLNEIKLPPSDNNPKKVNVGSIGRPGK